MSVRVTLPPVLRSLSGGRRELTTEGTTLDEVLRNLARNHPSLALHLFDDRGAVRRHILCIHDAAAIRPCDFASHTLKADDEVTITNALAGG